GPGAGAHGGNLAFDGTPGELAARTDLPTGRALAARQRSEKRTPIEAPEASGPVVIVGARANNLRDVDVLIPLGKVVAVAVPSGAGRRSLLDDGLARGIARAPGNRGVEPPGPSRRIEGPSGIPAVTPVAQSPLGRTSRGTPGPYPGAWNRIRAIFAAAPGAA